MKAGMVFDMDLMVCVGSSCHLQNSRDLINRLKELIAENRLEGRVELKGSFCMGHWACASNLPMRFTA